MEKPKRKNLNALWIILGLIVIFFLVLLALFALLSINRSMQARKNFNSRPLVLIHAPLNHESFEVGEMVSVHATARQGTGGLGSVELWVDDIRVAEHPAPEGENPASMVLLENWVPTLSGSHVVIVRATSADGVQGQASIVVEAEESTAPATGVYPVEEGDTLVSIAEEVGTSPEDLAELNPELGGEEPSAGDGLDVPGPDYSGEDTDRDGTEEDTAPGGGDDEGTSPEPEDAPPGGGGPFPDGGDWGAVFPDMGGDEAVFHGEPVALKVEVPNLRSMVPSERLYCYISLGMQPTLRIPDADGDPTTDESFTPLFGGFWDTTPYLLGTNAPIVYWPDEEDLPFEVACTGVAAGGTDALDMGSVDFSIPPENWDGSLHLMEAGSMEGSYIFSYRVSRVNDMRAAPLYQDPDMTAPTNVTLNDMANTLSWDYAPRPDEEAITGFRIYLNSTLQWVETAGQRESSLPPEWFNPPCGSTYTFAVTAYRFELPSGPESPPGEASITAPGEGEGCQRQIALNFLTLETFDLGSDGNYEDRGGDVGPPYGEFYANEWQAAFDARRPTDYWTSSLDEPIGLTHNTTYNLGEIATDDAWSFDMLPSTVVYLPEGGSLEFGFNIKDEDTGICNDDDDPGCDDNICNGMETVTESLDLHKEGSIVSTNSRCRVTYNYGPAPGSPAGGGAAGEVPLPWIEVTDVNADDIGDDISFILRNSGSAAWAGRTLEVGIETRTGEPLGVIPYENFALAAGESMGMGALELGLQPPYDICVTVDPNNLVEEYYEAYGGRTHTRFCPNLPDLTVNDVQYDATGAGRIRVTVGNIGDTSLDARTLKLQGFLPDGSPASLLGSWPNATILPYETHTFEISGITEGLRSMLQEGYRMVVDPDNTIAELNDANNSYDVSNVRLKVWFCNKCMPEYHSTRNLDRFNFYVSKFNGRSEYEYIVRDVERRDDSTDNRWASNCNSNLICYENSRVFSVLKDEVLHISMAAWQEYGVTDRLDYLGMAEQEYSVTENWGAFPAADENDWDHPEQCQRFSHTPDAEFVINEDPWWVNVCILQLP